MGPADGSSEGKNFGQNVRDFAFSPDLELIAWRQNYVPEHAEGYGDVLMADRYGYPGKVRHHGSFVVEAALFVTGGLRALVTDKVCLYDAAAGVVLAREVGAEVRELDGSVWDESLWTKTSTWRPFGFFPPESGWNFQSQ